MELKQLTTIQQNVAHECVAFVLKSKYISEGAFHPRIGCSRAEVKELLGRWPALNDADPSSADHAIINNCFNEVCHGIAVRSKDWSSWFHQSRDDIRQTFVKWRVSVGMGPDLDED